MQSSPHSPDGRRFTGCVAIAAAVLAWACAGFYVAATNGDFAMVQRPAEFLALPAKVLGYFHLAMLLDCLGFYLPFLIIGAYFWSQLRAEHGVKMDMTLLCIVIYVILGLAGAALQMAAVGPLAQVHATGDAVNQAASENAWLALTHGAQGLWLFQGPVMGLWGWLVGSALHRSGRPYGRLLMAVGLCYAGAFVAGVLGLTAVFEVVQSGFIVLLPLWSLLTGIHLLRSDGP